MRRKGVYMAPEKKMEERMKELIEELNKASDVYYNTGMELMPNIEWDAKFSELKNLENETGIILQNSPTQLVGAKTSIAGEEVIHEYPALSLDKTKDITIFPSVFSHGDGKAVVSWKEDGSTGIATYIDGALVSFASRGNGITGTNITPDARYIHGLPLIVPYKGKLIIRGEIVMSYAEFERINSELEEGQEPYSSPRNLATGTLGTKEIKNRTLWFKCFKLVHMDSDKPTKLSEQFDLLESYGISVVEHELTDNNKLIDTMNKFSGQVQQYPFPVDGLVVAAEDVAYADTLPSVNHNPHRLVGFALKWEDELVNTIIKGIEWSVSQTRINPVAVLEPVKIENSIVSRASLHNVSYVLEKDIKPGDHCSCYLANKIIPQINENFDADSSLSSLSAEERIERNAIARKCPVCGTRTKLECSKSGTIVLICPNPNCTAKKLKSFVHFCERDSMNIKGLSKETLRKFISKRFINCFSDIYFLNRYQNQIECMDGFGEKSYDAIWSAIEKSRNTSFIPFVNALNIPNVGIGQSKVLAKYFHTIQDFLAAAKKNTDFTYIEGIGNVISDSINTWADENLQPGNDIEVLLDQLHLEIANNATERSSITGKTFVITGSLLHFNNRRELQEKIESLGGKCTGTVTKKTDFLINNDAVDNTPSTKSKKAKELGIPVISEDDFIKMIM